jgi:hypothetical protein
VDAISSLKVINMNNLAFFVATMLYLGCAVSAIDIAFSPGTQSISSNTNYAVTVISNPTENFDIYFSVVSVNYDAQTYTTIIDSDEYFLTYNSEKIINILLTPGNYNARYKLTARKANGENDDGMVGSFVVPAFNIAVQQSIPTATPTPSPTPTPTPTTTPIPTYYNPTSAPIPTVTPTPFPIVYIDFTRPSIRPTVVVTASAPTPTPNVPTPAINQETPTPTPTPEISVLPVREPNPIVEASLAGMATAVTNNNGSKMIVLLLLVAAAFYMYSNNNITKKEKTEGDEGNA